MQRAWIAGIARDAQRVGRPIHLQDRPTQRRAAIVRGLVTLAGGGHDDDELLYTLAWHSFDEHTREAFEVGAIYSVEGAPPSQMLTLLTVDTAQQFAALCEAFTAGRMQATVDDDGTVRLTAA